MHLLVGVLLSFVILISFVAVSYPKPYTSVLKNDEHFGIGNDSSDNHLNEKSDDLTGNMNVVAIGMNSSDEDYINRKANPGSQESIEKKETTGADGNEFLAFRSGDHHFASGNLKQSKVGESDLQESTPESGNDDIVDGNTSSFKQLADAIRKFDNAGTSLIVKIRAEVPSDESENTLDGLRTALREMVVALEEMFGTKHEIVATLAINRSQLSDDGSNDNAVAGAREVNEGNGPLVQRWGTSIPLGDDNSGGEGNEKDDFGGAPDDEIPTNDPIVNNIDEEKLVRTKRASSDKNEKSDMDVYVFGVGYTGTFFGQLIAMFGLGATPVVTAAVVTGGLVIVGSVAAVAAYGILKGT